MLRPVDPLRRQKSMLAANLSRRAEVDHGDVWFINGQALNDVRALITETEADAQTVLADLLALAKLDAPIRPVHERTPIRTRLWRRPCQRRLVLAATVAQRLVWSEVTIRLRIASVRSATRVVHAPISAVRSRNAPFLGRSHATLSPALKPRLKPIA
jgi:hypothetical protein